MTRVGWLDASSGISGDMILGACVDAGVPLDVLRRQIDLMRLPEPVEFSVEDVLRSGLGASRLLVNVGESTAHRRLADVLALLEPLDTQIRNTAAEVFRMLAVAEAKVHRIAISDVHFHEVGALDSIADVVGVVAAVQWLQLDELSCSPIALGGGRTTSAHGSIPVPVPAVAELLAGTQVPVRGGPVDHELATPTGVALAITLAKEFGPMPPMVIDRTGTGAGARDLAGHANVVRLVIGTPGRVDGASSATAKTPVDEATVMDANVDDMDPRLWPGVIAALMEAGAADAWLTPILMKKGRPAHTISVLTTPDRVDAIMRVLLVHTSTIGLRRTSVDKFALARETVVVDLDGSSVRIKAARLADETVNVSAEFEDIARIAAETGKPQKQVLAEVLQRAQELGINSRRGN